MSSSPRPARVGEAGVAAGRLRIPPPIPPLTPVHEVLPFFFPEVAAGAGAVRPRVAGATQETDPGEAVNDTAERENRARSAGREEGLAESRQSFEDQLAKERSSVTTALTHFTRDRALYYEKIEAEVVQLALSIARKILHRETQVDPLLLAGLVRVAIEKMEKATRVTLRLHPRNADEWRGYFSIHLDPTDLPNIVEDTSIAPDRCLLETSMGVAELGMETQLKEIEQGMMDLLAARPDKIL